MKRCSCCKEKKPLSDFYKQAKSKDGHSYWCKLCSKDNSRRYKNKKTDVKNSRGVVAKGERLKESASDALTRFKLRLNFTGIEKLT